MVKEFDQIAKTYKTYGWYNKKNLTEKNDFKSSVFP